MKEVKAGGNKPNNATAKQGSHASNVGPNRIKGGVAPTPAKSVASSKPKAGGK